MLTEYQNGELFGVYFIEGISDHLCGIYTGNANNIQAVLDEYAQEETGRDFSEMIDDLIHENYRDELDAAETEKEYDKLYSEYEELEYSKWHVLPVKVSIDTERMGR